MSLTRKIVITFLFLCAVYLAFGFIAAEMFKNKEVYRIYRHGVDTSKVVNEKLGRINMQSPFITYHSNDSSAIIASYFYGTQGDGKVYSYLVKNPNGVWFVRYYSVIE